MLDEAPPWPSEGRAWAWGALSYTCGSSVGGAYVSVRVCEGAREACLPSCRSPLQVAAKQAAAAATQTIAASQNAAVSNKNPAAQQQLVQSCKVSFRPPESQGCRR